MSILLTMLIIYISPTLMKLYVYAKVDLDYHFILACIKIILVHAKPNPSPLSPQFID